MRKLFFLFVALLATTTLWAHDFEADSIYYNSLGWRTAEVTFRGDNYDSYDNEYSGYVTIPAMADWYGNRNVTSIGNDAFRGCANLTAVTIPDGVTSIGDYAFNGCSNLTSITIPDSVTSIGDYAFRGCSNLTSITIPDGVTSIGNGVFEGCSSLTSVTIPNSVTSIAYSAFRGCSSLTSITIPDGVTSIGAYAFEGCSSLTAVTIPSSVTSIVFGAFKDCRNLTNIIIPNSITSIEKYAFRGCSSLTSITIPNSVTSIGEHAFDGCSSLTTVTLNSNAIVSKSYTSGSNISHIFGSQVTNYVIGDSVKSIGEYAFSYCSNLTDVTIGNGVTAIESCAFYDCSSLTSVRISDIAAWCGINFSEYVNPLRYADNLYLNGELVTDLVIPEGVTSIGDHVFYHYSSLTSVILPNSVTSIGRFAFNGCSNLTSATIPNSVTSIGAGAFTHCSNLTNVTLNSNAIVSKSYEYESNISNIFGSQVTNYIIGDSVLSIGEHAFSYCRKLKSVTIGNSVTSIGDYAFYGSHSLPSVAISNSVTSIGYGAFAYCSSLTDITIPNSVTSIGAGAFESCSLTSVTIPNCVTSIRERVFYNCDITSITIPNSVTSIGKEAFSYCASMTSITIPNSVTSIGDGAFSACGSLTTLVCKATEIPNTAVNAFDYSKENEPTLYVPKASIDKYKSTEPWSYFTKILPIEDSGEDPSNPDDEETDRAITCEEAVSICQETGTTITTEKYTIRGYVTEIKTAYSEQYNNITFWMADTPTGGQVLQAYGVMPVEQNDKYIKVGDYVEVIGTLVNYNGNTPEVYKGGTYTIIQTDEDPSNPEDSPKDSITVKAKIPEHWTNTITAWTWGETSSGHWVTPTKDGDWYVVTEDVEELNIIFVNGTNWNGDNNQTIDMTFTANTCIQLAQEGSDKAIYTAIDCEGDDTSKDDEEEDDGAITCEEAVSICQETGTTITTEKYTIRGYVTEIKTAYSEQYNNITFWMADIPNGGKVLQAYRVIPVEANDIDVKVGDYVEVIGSLVNYYGTTPEVYMGGTYTIIPKGVSTYINNIKVPTNGSSTIFLRDGQFLILRDGKTYNVMGQEL